MTNLTELAEKLFDSKLEKDLKSSTTITRNPVHVVYGGADLFNQQTTNKIGDLAIKSLENNSPNFVDFAKTLWLKGSENLPKYEEVRQDLEFSLADDPNKIKQKNFDAWFAWTIYNKTLNKLKSEPVEDFRIDFEDGYGFRTDVEEDSHCISASNNLADTFLSRTITPFCGFRIKSFQTQTRKRAVRTLELFLDNLLEKTNGVLPQNFVVTLPKIRFIEEIEILDELLAAIEHDHGLEKDDIKIEIIIETAEAILNMQNFYLASKDRFAAAHFGAYDYTSGYGITANHQHLQHKACDFARNMMQVSLSPYKIRLSDSVTTEIPVQIHKKENLSIQEIAENKVYLKNAWRRHYNNVTNSLINGFYQSWDLHPAQLVARYAAVYAFFLDSFDTQADRLNRFLDKATKATITGNQFDDLASAEGLLNFFLQGINCQAFTVADVTALTDLSEEEISFASFYKIIKNRS